MSRFPRGLVRVTTASMRLAVLAIAALLSACPAAEVVREPALEPDAVRALELYREALVAGRTAEAFALIHPDALEGLDEAGFARLFERHHDALVAQADRLLLAARASRAAERAEVATDRGVVVLERTSEGWRLLAPVGAPPPSAPEAP